MPDPIAAPEARWKFSDRADLEHYLAESFGLDPQHPDQLVLSGRALRDMGIDPRRGRSGAMLNPFLARATSPTGIISIGGVSLDTREIIPAVSHAVICQSDPDTGFERCADDNGRRVTYRRSDGSTIRMEVWLDSTFGFWSAGGEIATNGLDFVAARIHGVRFFTPVGPTCAADNPKVENGANDDELDQSDWGTPLSEKPRRYLAAFQVQWGNRRFVEILSTESDCLVVGQVPLPEEFPDDWPPLEPDPVPGRLTVGPRRVTINDRPGGGPSVARIRIGNTHDQPREVTVGPIEPRPHQGPLLPSARGRFTNQSGVLTVPANGSVETVVRFDGTGGFGSLQARLEISGDGQRFPVTVTGHVLQVIGGF